MPIKYSAVPKLLHHSAERQEKEHESGGQSHPKPGVGSKQDSRGLDADFQIIFSILNSINRIVDNGPTDGGGKEQPGSWSLIHCERQPMPSLLPIQRRRLELIGECEENVCKRDSIPASKTATGLRTQVSGIQKAYEVQ